MEPYWSDGERTLWHGDCLDVLPTLDADSVDLCLTDPPYALTGASRGGSRRTNDPKKPYGRHNLAPKGFMGKTWDGQLADPRIWSEVLRVLKPGAFLFAFMTPRQDCHARFLIQLEDAGFDTSYYPIQWLYLSGFPKGHDISAAIDRAAGVSPAEYRRRDKLIREALAEKGFEEVVWSDDRE